MIFMTGSLGDTLAAVPALDAIRTHWPDADLIVLCDAQVGSVRVTPQDVLAGAGVVNRFIEYPVRQTAGTWKDRLKAFFALWRNMRRERPDVLVYLIRAFHGDRRVKRDILFFRAAGVAKIVGASKLPEREPPVRDGRMQRLPRLGDQYLQRLAASGISTPLPGQGRADIGLIDADYARFENWRGTLPPDGGRAWVAFGTGSKMPAKLWPLHRYVEVGRRLISDYDVWPVIFGGPVDADLGRGLVSQWGRGCVAAGQLDVRASAAALSRCHLYVGNDTGTMHLAASAGVRCVAIFSARDYPGLWEPYGKGHVILRRDVPCAGCGQEVCPIAGHPCIQNIEIDEVLSACHGVLSKPFAISSP